MIMLAMMTRKKQTVTDCKQAVEKRYNVTCIGTQCTHVFFWIKSVFKQKDPIRLKAKKEKNTLTEEKQYRNKNKWSLAQNS